MTIARQGLPYIGALAAIGVVALVISPSRWVAIPFFALAAFVAFFFRDPTRIGPAGEKLLLSPGDGKVVYVGAGEREPAKQQISIFLSIFDVHINRSPLTATVKNVKYTPGEFLVAWDPDAGAKNEQNQLVLVDGDFEIFVRQIAGVVARRIVCTVRENDRLERGQRFGLIQFGSRMEVILPNDVELRVKVGDRVKGGETVIAERT